MAFQPCPNIAKVAVAAQLNGEECVSTTHWYQAGAWGSAELSALAESVRDLWNDLFLPSLPTLYVAYSVEAKGLRTQIDIATLSEFNPPAAGTLGGAIMPNNVSLAVKFSSPFTGRSTRGRNFWPAFVEGDVTGNVIASERISAIVGAYEDLKDLTLAASGFSMVVLSRVQNGVTLANGIGYGITDISVEDDIVDSMRRRLPKRGS